MARKTGMSEVKFKVRHNALLLREFTVADIVRATGLNPESVRTELQRMKREGLLISCPHPDKPKRRGGRPALYRLTDAHEARLSLSESIEAFYPPPPPADRPTSRHYLLAQQALDQAQTEDDSRQFSQLLDQAERDLQMAEQAEGGSLASESVRARLQYEYGRLAYLRGQSEEAKNSFEALRVFFTDIHDEKMVERSREFLLCLQAWNRFSLGPPCGSVRDEAWARCLLATLAEEAYQTDSPLTLLLVQLLRSLSETIYEKVRAAALELAMELSRREIRAEVGEALRTEQLRISFETAAPLRGERLLQSEWLQREELRPARLRAWEFENSVDRLPPRPDQGSKYARDH